MLEFLQELLIELAAEYIGIERHQITEVSFTDHGMIEMIVSYDVIDGTDDRIIGEASETIRPYDLLGGNRL